MIDRLPNIIYEHVEQPTEEIAKEAIRVFVSVMDKDPSTISLTGGDLTLLPDLGGAVIRPLALCPGVGHLFTARDETGALVGFTLYSLPGKLACSTPEQQAYGMTDFMKKLSPEGRAYYADTIGKKVPAAYNDLFGIEAMPRKAYWCNFAMVREEHQGKGIATRLFQMASQEAAKLNATMGLATSNIRNVPIYEHLGFKLLGGRLMQSPWGDWTLWAFVKDDSEEQPSVVVGDPVAQDRG
ncbi:hypothetical protein C8Q76DRAFT_74304 [Earliella scabrosa]|nr:hypothetical protein C8Q76DRAFT_74304 [Earliella scabrosa]